MGEETALEQLRKEDVARYVSAIVALHKAELLSYEESREKLGI